MTSNDYGIRNLALAGQGQKSIEWALEEIPVLP
jgi:S-adenosylhomocysteine hydrolase